MEKTWLHGRAKVTGLIFFQSCSPISELWDPLPSGVWIASAAYLKPIPRCTIKGPLHKEDAWLFVLKACLGEEWTAVWFVCLICPHSDFSWSGAGCTARGGKDQCSVPGPCAWVHRELQQCWSGFSKQVFQGQVGPADQWNRQTLNEILRHGGAQLWKTVGRSIF